MSEMKRLKGRRNEAHFGVLEKASDHGAFLRLLQIKKLNEQRPA